MLDFSDKNAERISTSIVGQALAFKMNNSTDDGQTSSGSGRAVAGDSITACLDTKRQKIVPIGEYYYSDSCTLCLCSNAESMCKQISCAPPEKCDGYIKKDPSHCCDVCVSDVVVERPNDHTSLNMKLGALTVALFLVISLVLFTLHRMRRKRLLITLRRLQSFRHRDSVCSHSGRPSMDAADGGLFLTSPTTILSAAERAAVIAEGPPPYNAAVTLPRAPEPLARAPPRCTAPAEPPPPYRQVIQETSTIRRCTVSQNGHQPLSVSIGAGRHSRTSDYPEEDDEDIEARSTTTCSSSTSSLSSSDSSLSSSRDSLNVLDEIDTNENCCSCSQCDSGLSEERGSFSSNEIRPRSEMLMTVSPNTHVILGQASSQQLLRQTSQPAPSSAAPSERRRNSRPEENGDCGETSNGGVGAERRSKGKLCKKKLKKLMMKARRKAKRGRRIGEDGDAGVENNNATAVEGEFSRRNAHPSTGRSTYAGSAQASGVEGTETLPVTSV